MSIVNVVAPERNLAAPTESAATEAAMEAASRVMSAAMNAANNNTAINVFLVGSFLALSARSVKQQNDIKALEAEKESRTKSNKVMRKAMWDWKQQLLAEASAPGSSAIPFARVKVIYGESPNPPTGDAPKGDTKSSAPKFLI